MTRRRVVSVCVIMAAFAGVSWGQTEAPSMSAADLIQMAIQRNREFLAVKQHIAETQALLRQAGVRPSPTIEVQESTGRPLGTRGEQEFSAGYFHTFETSGKRGKRIAVAQKAAEGAEAEVNDRVRLLAFEVSDKYAEAIAEQKKLQAIQQLLSVNRDYYRITEARVQHGDAAPLEGQLFLADLNRAEAQQVVFADRSDRALFELRKVVGISAAEPLNIRDEVLPVPKNQTVSQWQEQALRIRPDLTILRLMEEQAVAEAELARAEGKPDFTASAQYSRTNSAFDQLGLDSAGKTVPLRDRDNVLRFGLSVPIFQPKRNQGVIEAAVARSNAARLRREHLESVIRLEVASALRRWESASRVLEILNSGVIGQSQKNMEVVRQAYALGQLRILDVLNEQKKLIDTQLSYIDARAELLHSSAELERASGGSIQ